MAALAVAPKIEQAKPTFPRFIKLTPEQRAEVSAFVDAEYALYGRDQEDGL